MEDAFAAYHPAVGFLFFLGAIITGMCFSHPLFLAISLFSSLLYYLLLRGRKGLKFLGGMVLLWAAMAALNAVLVQEGDTVLFTYWGGRVFTREALLYGICAGSIFLSVMLWFSCYNVVMTSDKFICLFGRLIPSLSLLLSMILRLIPNFENKAKTIMGARRCIGMSPDNGEKRERLRHSADILSVLTSWALEGAVVTADSMKSRGYGSGERSNFNIFRRSSRDTVAAGVLLGGLALLLVGVSHGAARAEFYPRITLGEWNGYTLLGALGYAVFLLTPSAIHIGEDVTWRILRLRI